MKKKDKQFYMTESELLEVKQKSIQKLEDKNLTDDEVQEIKELINLIDKALEELKKESSKRGWSRVFEIVINILGIGLPYLIEKLLTKKQ